MNVSVIAAADDHACALRTDGTVWCWGENNARQLGDGTGTARNRPALVLGLADVTATALACGGDQCCVALTDGAVRCWGDNASGQLGDNTTTDRDRATSVSGLLGVSALSTRGTGHTCALGSGVLRCWGLNDGGQLGIGNTTSQGLPALVTF
jgi:alpha-tubulin suppressor-like RCC1 family protein